MCIHNHHTHIVPAAAFVVVVLPRRYKIEVEIGTMKQL